MMPLCLAEARGRYSQRSLDEEVHLLRNDNITYSFVFLGACEKIDDLPRWYSGKESACQGRR